MLKHEAYDTPQIVVWRRVLQVSGGGTDGDMHDWPSLAGLAKLFSHQQRCGPIPDSRHVASEAMMLK